MANETILVPAELPAVPLVLADAKFLVTLAGVEAQVATLTVNDVAAAQEAANLLRRLTEAGNGIEKTRVALKAPFTNIGRKIDEVAKLVSQRIDASKGKLSSSLALWNAKERERLAALERARQAEIRRLEEEKRRQDEAERARVAALVAATPPAEVVDFDFEAPVQAPKTETEQRIDALKYAPAPVVAKPSGISFKQTLRFTVKDVHALPDEFKLVTPNDQAIRQTFCVGFKEGMPLPVVAGVEFFVENTAVSTGRASP